MRRGIALTAAMAVGTVAWVVHAQEQPTVPSKLPERRAVIVRDTTSKALSASFGYRDVVDVEARRKLQSGLTTVITLAGGVFEAEGGDRPVAGTGIWQSCRVTFDVWNEVYRLQITRAEGDRKAIAVNLEGVLRRCTEAHALVVQGTLTPGSKYFLAATVEVNPVSQEMLEQIRRWVSRPPGTGAVSPGDSLFGSFVGLFVARIGKADRSLSFRTQTFVVPP